LSPSILCTTPSCWLAIMVETLFFLRFAQVTLSGIVQPLARNSRSEKGRAAYSLPPPPAALCIPPGRPACTPGHPSCPFAFLCVAQQRRHGRQSRGGRGEAAAGSGAASRTAEPVKGMRLNTFFCCKTALVGRMFWRAQASKVKSQQPAASRRRRPWALARRYPMCLRAFWVNFCVFNGHFRQYYGLRKY
jgi:hypothetical protein